MDDWQVGSYSLFQYCPFPDRHEALNVGLVFVVDGQVVGFEFKESTERLKLLWDVDDLLYAMQIRTFSSWCAKCKTSEDVANLRGRLANDIVLTAPNLFRFPGTAEDRLQSLIRELL